MVLWILSSFVSLGTADASPITSQQAQQNAMDFLKKKGKTVSKTALRDVSSKDATSKNYYVFNIGTNEGFVIAAADDQVPAILGYASHGTVLIEAMPANLKAWLDSYDKQISYIQEQGIKGSTPITSTHAAISPLMTTTWNQTDPYNQSCPDFFSYGKSVTGCVATAMAQVMYYHRNRSVNQIAATIPAYTCQTQWNSDDGAQQISVAAVPAGSVIDWNNMLTNYTGSETAAQKKAIADFMFYCGASVSMDYANSSNGGSGAYSEDVPGAMKTYFGYSDNTRLVSRDNYTNDSWDNLIYNELSNNRPVFYSGVTSSNGGHAFVCDGYDSNGYYHINWGWGGYCDTYFLLSDLTPQDQGTGGSSGGYNYSQQALIGAEPSGNVTPPVQQYTVTLPGHTLYYINCYDRNNNLIFSNTEEGMTGGENANFQCDAGSYLKLEIVWSGFAGDSPSTPPTMYINGNSIGNGQTFTINSVSSDIDVTVSLFKISCDIIGNGSVRITKNGSVISNNASIIDGDQITLELLPDAGYRLKKLEEHIPRMEMEVNELNVQNNTYSFSYSWNHFNGDAQFAVEFEEIPSVQKYTVSVNTTDSSLHIYDKNGNDITEDVHNGTKFDAGSYFHFVLEIGDAYYISEIRVNGVSVGQWNENNPNYDYVIENLTGDMTVEFTYETPVKYKTVYCTANGPGNVKMYKNGTYVGITTDNGSGYKVVSVVIDQNAKDEIKLEFIPDEGSRFLELHRGFYDVDLEQDGSDITNAVINNTYTIKYISDEYMFSRMFAATFEKENVTLSVANQDAVGGSDYSFIEVPALYYQPVIYAKNTNSRMEAYYYLDKNGKKLEGLDWRFDDGAFAPPSSLSAIELDPETMDGYDYTGESWQETMLSIYRASVEKFSTIKTAKLVPAAVATYRVTPETFSLNDYALGFKTTTNIVIEPVKARNSGYLNSMADHFASPVTTVGSNYTIQDGLLAVPFTLNDWEKYVEDLAYYVSPVDDESLKDSVNYISLQLTKNDETITSESVAVFPAFLHINGIIDNKPDNQLLDCMTEEENWPTKGNDNAGSMYKYASQAIERAYTHSIPYNQTLDILPFVETHFTYIGKKTNWKEQSQKMDAETFKQLGLSYRFSIVDYEDGNHATGESRHITIDAKANYSSDFGYDEVILTPRSVTYDPNGISYSTILNREATREVIGREPLIKVEIVDPNNSVLYVGYMKILITDDETQPISHQNGTLSTSFSIDDDYWMNCTAQGGLKWSQMEEFLSMLGENGYSKQQFEDEYEIDAITDGVYAKHFVLSDGGFVEDMNPIGDVYYTKSYVNDMGNNQTNVILWVVGSDYSSIAKRITGTGNYNDARHVLLNNHGEGNYSNNLSTTIRFVKKNVDNPEIDAIYVTLSIPGNQVHFAYGEVKNRDLSHWYRLNSYKNGSETEGTAIDILENVPTPVETSYTMLETGTANTPTFEFERPLLGNFLNEIITIDMGGKERSFNKYTYARNGKNINVGFEFTLPVQGVNAEFSHDSGVWNVTGYSGHNYSLHLSNDRKAIVDEHNCVIAEILDYAGQPYIHMVDNNCANDILNYSGRYDDNGNDKGNEANSNPFYLENGPNRKETFTAYLKIVTDDECYDLLLKDNYFNTKFLRPINVWGKSITIVPENSVQYILPTDLLTAKDWRNYTLTLDRDLYGDNNYEEGQVGWDFYNIYAITTNYNEIYTDHAAEKSIRDAISAELTSNSNLSEMLVNYKNQLNKVSQVPSLNENNLKVTEIARHNGVKVGNRQYKTAPQTCIEFTNTGDNNQTYHLFVPVYVQYAWGHSLNHLNNQPNTFKVWTVITVKNDELETPDNTIYMDDMEVLSGTEAVLSVKMKNTVVAEGFGFDMYLPDGITVLQDEDGFPEVTLSTERTNSRKTNSFDAVFNADGSLRVLGASTNGSTISGNDGEIVQVKVAIADDMVEGDYTVCFKNIAISDENAESHTSAMTTSTIKVNTYIIGDANIDRKVDVADFTAVAHHLLNNTPQSFHMKAADANTDNRIDVGDLTAIAHLILYGTITKPTNTSGAKPFMMMNESPADENYIYIEPVSVQGQSEVTLSVKMRNAVEAEGFEFDLYLPDGMSFVTDAEGFAEVSLSTERTNSKKTNSFDSVIQEDGSLRVLAASTNGSSISGNDGEVALVTIHIDPNLAAAEYPLQLKNIAIADVNAVSHSTDLKESTITILGSGIVTGVEKVQSSKFKVQSDEWYSLDGKKLNSMPKTAGVYIKNGNKVVVK